MPCAQIGHVQIANSLSRNENNFLKFSSGFLSVKVLFYRQFGGVLVCGLVVSWVRVFFLRSDNDLPSACTCGYCVISKHLFACSERGKQTSFFDLPQVSLLREEINTSMDHSGEARMS